MRVLQPGGAFNRESSCVSNGHFLLSPVCVLHRATGASPTISSTGTY